MDGGAWWSAVHGVAKSRTRLTDFTFTFHFHALESPSTVILEPQNIKSDTVSTVSPSISHEVMGPDAMVFVF